MENQENFITRHCYQINNPNGDIDFITVDDLPDHLALKFVKDKYPGIEPEFVDKIVNQNT